MSYETRSIPINGRANLMFEILNREAAKAAIMQKIDEGFAQMSAK